MLAAGRTVTLQTFLKSTCIAATAARRAPAHAAFARRCSSTAFMSSSSAAAPAAAPSAPAQRPLVHLERAVECLTPLSLAERAWDNVGIMVEAPTVRTDSKRRIVLCNDLTTQVCDEALAHPDIFAILAYHPPIFGGLKSITLANPLQRSLLRCVASGVSVYAIHTASDSAVGGVNDYMASGLLQAAGVKTDQDGMIQPGTGNGSKAITPAKDVPEGQAGAGGGRLVDLLEASGGRKLARHEAVQAVKERLNLKHLQAAWSPTGVDEIQTVAICAGSGAGVLKGVPADLYLTGEMSHHDILAATAAGTHVFCCNHSATERPWLSYYAPRLQKALNAEAQAEKGAGGEVAYEVVVSTADREPLEVV